VSSPDTNGRYDGPPVSGPPELNQPRPHRSNDGDSVGERGGHHGSSLRIGRSVTSSAAAQTVASRCASGRTL
jgi:hypothetical protein